MSNVQVKTTEMPKTKPNYKDKLAEWADDKRYNCKSDNLEQYFLCQANRH
jgi:hypothetical protein